MISPEAVRLETINNARFLVHEDGSDYQSTANKMQLFSIYLFLYVAVRFRPLLLHAANQDG